MNLQEIDWDKIIEENVKSQFVEINKSITGRYGFSIRTYIY